MIEVQTRSEENGLQFFPTIAQAFQAAKEDFTIWKVSFSVEGERVRMVRSGEHWIYEPIDPLSLIELT